MYAASDPNKRLCKDCSRFAEMDYPYPNACAFFVDRIFGNPITLAEARGSDDLCGPRGRNFEPRQVNASTPLQKLIHERPEFTEEGHG